ncbi:hypothetical protein [Alistipes sp.]|uniref:hypothetical protein n=1 Tax=Alistipes sp. TaxID=1872444 RepID=UPI003AF1AD42
MKLLARLVFVLPVAALLATACSKDEEEDTSSLVFNDPALYFSAPGERGVASFSADGVSDLYISSRPEGWNDITLDAAARTVTVVAPVESKEDETALSGSVVISGVSYMGGARSATLFVGMVKTTDLSDKPANSYIVREKQTHYTFDVTLGGKISPAGVGLIWQSAAGLLQYVQMDGGKASFYVGSDSEDKHIHEGNALIGAYDAAGTLLWSWHVWATPYDPESDVLHYANGYEVMGRNLGALDNANTTPEERVASYGLYYQWGRKDPFIGPASYRANSGSGAAMYNASGSRVYVTPVASSAETGTSDYARRNPLSFITGVADSGNDWLWTADDARWGAKKTENDPCPYGWKVAPEGAFAGLTIADTPKESDYDVFGWTLTDGSVSSLYLAAGRRIYSNGAIQNIYIPPVGVRADEAQPWEGLYWTAGSLAERKSPALYFWFEKLTTTAGIEPAAPYARANGMSVRCVRDK